MPIASVNPATGETLQNFSPLTDAEVQVKLALAAEAFQQHRLAAFADRAAKMTAGGRDFGPRETRDCPDDDFGSRQNASIISGGSGEVRSRLPLLCRTCRAAFGGSGVCSRRGAGLCPLPAAGADPRHHAPGTFRSWQVIRFAAPALMAGNVGLLKHALSVPQCALFLEELFQRAGFPEGVFQTLLIETEQVSAILDDPRVVAAHVDGQRTSWERCRGTVRTAFEKSRVGTRRQ